MVACSARSSHSAKASSPRWPLPPAVPAPKRHQISCRSSPKKSPAGSTDPAPAEYFPATADRRPGSTGDIADPGQAHACHMESLAQLLALVLTAVALVPAAAHVLELPNKL